MANHRRVNRIRYSLLGALLLTSCGPSAQQGQVNPYVAPTAAITPAAEPSPVDPEPSPTPRTHKYADKDGDYYTYVGEVSEDDKKKGKAAGPVFTVSYVGEESGVYTLKSHNGFAQNEPIYSCKNPCAVIKVYSGNQVIDRVAYSPNSLLGAAFEDAFSGDLHASKRVESASANQQVYVPAIGSIEEGYRFRGGDPSKQSSWEPVDTGKPKNFFDQFDNQTAAQ